MATEKDVKHPSPALSPLPNVTVDNADEALHIVQQQQGIGAELDEAASRRILRKVDMVLMPMLCVVYGLNFLDKTTLSYASVTGIQKDIGLKGDEYSWLGSVFYFEEGYLGFEYPAVRLLQRLPLGKYSAFCVIAWGITLACFAAVHNFAGAVVVRLLLGIFEASVSPGWALFTSQWYTKSEQAVRIGWWLSFNGWAQIFGGLVAYGIAHHASAHTYSIAPWKIIYLFTGLLTAVVGTVFLFIVPDNQLNAWWLSKHDRVLAVERVRINQQGIGNKHFKMYQFREALTDPISWAFVLLALVGDIPNGGLSNFFSLLIVSFGYTPEKSLLYGAISGAIEIFAILGWAYTARLCNNRILTAVPGLLIALLGACLIVALPEENSRGRLAGFYLAQTWIASDVAVFSLLATNIAGYTKKTTVSAMFFIAYCVGNIIGPQTFRPKDAPRYLPAEIVLIACYSASIPLMLFIYWHFRRQNMQKAAKRAATSYEKLENSEFFDLTDRENLEFIYVL